MLFLQPWFWAFAVTALAVYWVCPPRFKPYWLLLASAMFHYHFAGPAGVAPIIVLALLTYSVGLATAAQPAGRSYAMAMLVLVAALGFYKYSRLGARTGAALLGFLGVHVAPEVWEWQLAGAPLGISFFTFEFVHYLYEIRVHRRPAVRNPVHFALFAIFFPTLVSGPIKRFPDFVPQLAALHNPGRAEMWLAVRRIIRGLFKKICIADLLVEYIKVFEDVPHFNAPLVVSLAVLQGWRIYYDFAGYSDIAIGFGQLFGLRLPENFDRPFGATSLREFWRRWHMSLSAWIRDYIYIPLGGNRMHRGFNLAAAMLLCGLWHGAAWHFAIWGSYHGAGLAVEAAVRRRFPVAFGAARRWQVLGWLLCCAYVTYGWLLFFYPVAQVYTMTREAIIWWQPY